jgi:DeoR/GlpR family transcriptional regulator of sugar metabolism
MLPARRQDAILARVRSHGAVSADELASTLEVSVETIRRDLRALRDQGLLNRVHGGATRSAHRSSEASYTDRSGLHVPGKHAIAALAATLVSDAETIMIDSGTTALQFARALPATFHGRVLTNSVRVADELSARGEIELLLSGGQIRPGDGAGYGPHAEAFFADFYASKAFLGAGGIHVSAGLTDYYPAEAAVRRAMVAHSAETFVLADASKLGVIAVQRVCPVDELTAVLTDEAADAPSVAALSDSVRVLRATTEPVKPPDAQSRPG